MTPQDILEFWFAGNPSERWKKWFEKSSGFDTRCAEFTTAIRDARAGHQDHWAATPKGALALIVLLDQLSRNVFRGSAEAFAADPHAQEIACATVTSGIETALTPVERMFIYLPFQHAETIEAQNKSVRLFETLRDTLGAKTTGYAHRHSDVIRAFGVSRIATRRLAEPARPPR
jgi:uncharacterized protein (DUF924 family)